MMRMNLFSLFLGTVLVSSSHAFLVSPNTNNDNKALAAVSARTTTTPASRRSFLQEFTVASITTASVAVMFNPLAARADITSKVASSAALRNVKSSQKSMLALQEYVSTNDYAATKLAFREAPLSEIRKSCTTLVKGAEDGPDAEKMADGYKAFIRAVEKMDSQASLAMRGRKLADGEFDKSYRASVDTMQEFLVLAEESVAIPMQYPAEVAE